jgi:hypothetical protein
VGLGRYSELSLTGERGARVERRQDPRAPGIAGWPRRGLAPLRRHKHLLVTAVTAADERIVVLPLAESTMPRRPTLRGWSSPRTRVCRTSGSRPPPQAPVKWPTQAPGSAKGSRQSASTPVPSSASAPLRARQRLARSEVSAASRRTPDARNPSSVRSISVSFGRMVSRVLSVDLWVVAGARGRSTGVTRRGGSSGVRLGEAPPV